MDATQPGAALGIIGCQVFEDEIVHVIAQDRSIDKVLVIESPEGKGVYDKLKRTEMADRVSYIKEIRVEDGPPSSGFHVIINVLPISLHQTPAALRARVMSEIWKMEPTCISIMLFYGICGHAFTNIEAMQTGLRATVVILKDRQDKIVDDCVGAVLGGTDEYLDYLMNVKGGYPLNTMWAFNFRQFMNEIQLLGKNSDIDEAKFVFQCMNYSKIVELDTGLGGEEYHRKITEIAHLFSFEVHKVPCTLAIIDGTYERAKKRMANTAIRFK